MELLGNMLKTKKKNSSQDIKLWNSLLKNTIRCCKMLKVQELKPNKLTEENSIKCKEETLFTLQKPPNHKSVDTGVPGDNTCTLLLGQICSTAVAGNQIVNQMSLKFTVQQFVMHIPQKRFRHHKIYHYETIQSHEGLGETLIASGRKES